MQAEDAVRLETDKLDIDQVLEALLAHIRTPAGEGQA